MPKKELMVDFTPHTSLFSSEKIGSNFMGLGYALGEIIANSLDWSMLSKGEAKSISEDAAQTRDGQEFLSNIEKEYGTLGTIISDKTPEISISFEKGRIVIKDNGVGMTFSELQDAIQMNDGDVRVIGDSAATYAKSHFGLDSLAKEILS